MYIYIKNSLFDSPAHVLVNTVNTVGVMGKGIAKTFKDIYPDMFREYQKHCESKTLSIGKLWIYKTENKWILSFPTKIHWRSPSKLEYIEEGLKKFVQTYKEQQIKSIAFPQLGCGNGGLDWDKEVKPLMEKYLRNLPDIDIYVHVIDKSNRYVEHRSISETKKWLNNFPRQLSYFEVWSDLKDLVIKNKDLETPYGSYTIETTISIAQQTEMNMSEHFSADVPSLLIRNNNNNLVNFNITDLYNIWTIFRDRGILVKSDFPFELYPVTDVMFELLKKLNYIDPVVIESKNTDGVMVEEQALTLVNRITTEKGTTVE